MATEGPNDLQEILNQLRVISTPARRYPTIKMIWMTTLRANWLTTPDGDNNESKVSVKLTPRSFKSTVLSAAWIKKPNGTSDELIEILRRNTKQLSDKNTDILGCYNVDLAWGKELLNKRKLTWPKKIYLCLRDGCCEMWNLFGLKWCHHHHPDYHPSCRTHTEAQPFS